MLKISLEVLWKRRLDIMEKIERSAAVNCQLWMMSREQNRPIRNKVVECMLEATLVRILVPKMFLRK
jgi:hypothetical protein